MTIKWGFQTRVLAAGASGAAKGKSVEIDIYDIIGEGFFWRGVTAKDVLRTLKENRDAATVRLRINSQGGDVIDGLAIYELLRDHAARVEVDIDSLAASMASVIAMAGDERRIAAGGLFMIHNPWGFGVGESDDLRAHADLLDKMRDIMVGLYAARTKKKPDEIQKWMAAETWFNADEALAAGFVDSISPAKGKESQKARAMAFVALAANRSSFFNLPEQVIGELPEDPQASLRGLLAEEQATAPPPVARAGDLITTGLPAAPPPAPAAAATPPIPPAPVARTNDPVTGKEPTTMSDENKTTNYGSIIAALGLVAGATETDILARLGRLRELESQAMALTGVTDSAQLVGSLRGMKERADAADAAQKELAQVKAERDKQRFEGLIAKGEADRKLTPAEAKQYQDVFAQRVAAGRGAEYVAEVEGYINAAPRKFAAPATQPAPLRGSGSAVTGAATTWNGKTYADLAPMEKHRLQKEDPELFDQMRSEHQQRVA